MTVEAATFISQLDPLLPSSLDLKSEGDNHIRLSKSVLKNQFPNLGAIAVTPTAAILNTVGVTQLATDNTTNTATTAMVQAAILAASGITAALPAQSGNAGKFLATNGTLAAWQYPSLPTVPAASTTETAVAGNHYLMTNVAASTLTLPPTPAAGDEVWVTFTNGLYTNNIDRNGGTIFGDASDFLINAGVLLTWRFKYLNNDWKTV